MYRSISGVQIFGRALQEGTKRFVCIASPLLTLESCMSRGGDVETESNGTK